MYPTGVQEATVYLEPVSTMVEVMEMFDLRISMEDPNSRRCEASEPQRLRKVG